MNQNEAEIIIQGIKTKCDSGLLDWGYVDSADSICHLWLLLISSSSDLQRVWGLAGTSCFGLAYEAREETLADYMSFMETAIYQSSDAYKELEYVASRLIEEGAADKQFKLGKLLCDASSDTPLEFPDKEEFIQALILSSANQGNSEATAFASEKGWGDELGS